MTWSPMNRNDIIALLAAYRRPGSPVYGRHFLRLPADLIDRVRVPQLIDILEDDSLPQFSYGVTLFGRSGVQYRNAPTQKRLEKEARQMKALKILSSIALLAGLMACGGDSKSVTGPEDNGNADQLKGDESLAPDRDDGQEGSGVPDNSSGGSDPNILIDPATDPVIDPAVVNTADLIQLLEAAGISVEKTGELVEQPFFTPAGQILKIGDEVVQVFEYETVDALKTEVRQVGQTDRRLARRWSPGWYRPGSMPLAISSCSMSARTRACSGRSTRSWAVPSPEQISVCRQTICQFMTRRSPRWTTSPDVWRLSGSR